ncbi:MAG: hypothetical protein IJT05_02890 [Lachnospiraceae bacterium]|nr:hypothetical protein [Lachnospiraceae bacterium]
MNEQATNEVLTQDERFLKKAYRRALIPSILSILSGCLNILADGIIVGQRIGMNGLTAINLCVPIYLVLCVIGSFFVSGTAIAASEEIGKENTDAAQRYYGTCLTSCLIASALAMLIGLLLLPAAANMLNPDEAVREMIRAYAGVTLIGAIPKIMIYIPFWYLRLDGKNTSVTVMMVIMGVGNILLDIAFMYGLNMGVLGAALASVIATAGAWLFGMVRVHTGHTNFALRFQFLREKAAWKKIVTAGSPAALNNALQSLRILTVNGILLLMGGNPLVAAFTAVNGIAAFAEAVTVGVPQAGTAMLGVYHGERDTGSTRILIGLEWRYGLIAGAVFSAFIIAGYGLIGDAYGLTDISLLIPMICLAISLFPGLWNGMMINLYNVSGHAVLSDLMIICRVYLFATLSLLVCSRLQLNPWIFLPLSEGLTVLFWFVATKIISSRRDNITRYLLLDPKHQKDGQVLNFSLAGNTEAICDACERISAFCEELGMDRKAYMRISLSMEELMTLIVQVNKDSPVTFDLRVFSLQGVTGIRIRYGGIFFDPVHSKDYDNEEFMGFRMIEKLVVEVVYRQTFGVNTLLILI